MLKSLTKIINAPNKKRTNRKHRKKRRDEVVRFLDSFEQSTTIAEAERIASDIVGIVKDTKTFASQEDFESSVKLSSSLAGRDKDAIIRSLDFVVKAHQQLGASNIQDAIIQLQYVPIASNLTQMTMMYNAAMKKLSVVKTFALSRSEELCDAYDRAKAAIDNFPSLEYHRLQVSDNAVRLAESNNQYSVNAVKLSDNQLAESNNQYSDNAVKMSGHTGCEFSNNAVKLAKYRRDEALGKQSRQTGIRKEERGEIEEATDRTKTLVEYGRSHVHEVHFYSRCFQRDIRYSEAKECRLYGWWDESFDPDYPDAIKYHHYGLGLTLVVDRLDNDKFVTGWWHDNQRNCFAEKPRQPSYAQGANELVSVYSYALEIQDEFAYTIGKHAYKVECREKELDDCKGKLSRVKAQLDEAREEHDAGMAELESGDETELDHGDVDEWESDCNAHLEQFLEDIDKEDADRASNDIITPSAKRKHNIGYSSQNKRRKLEWDPSIGGAY